MHTNQPNGSVKPSATVYSTIFTFGERENLLILLVLMCKLSLWASLSAVFSFFCKFTFLLYANFSPDGRIQSDFFVFFFHTQVLNCLQNRWKTCSFFMADWGIRNVHRVAEAQRINVNSAFYKLHS